MIKILHLISDLSTGGAEMMLYKLVAKMERSKFLNVVVSMTDRGSLGDQIESEHCRKHLDIQETISNLAKVYSSWGKRYSTEWE